MSEIQVQGEGERDIRSSHAACGNLISHDLPRRIIISNFRRENHSAMRNYDCDGRVNNDDDDDDGQDLLQDAAPPNAPCLSVGRSALHHGENNNNIMRACDAFDRSSPTVPGRTHFADAFAQSAERQPSSARITTRTKRRRRTRNPSRLALHLFMATLACAKVLIDPVLYYVGADAVVEDSKPEDAGDDATEAQNVALDEDGGGGETVPASEGDAPAGDPLPLPASLMKATRVGAKLREVHAHDDDDDDDDDETEITSPNLNNVEEAPHNPKAPISGCHWGAKDCKKAKWSGSGGTAAAAAGGGGATEMNASSTLETTTGVEEGHHVVGEEGGTGITSLAGSAKPKIEARVMKHQGHRGATGATALSGAKPPPIWDRDAAEKLKEGSGSGSGSGNTPNKPPPGFKLAGRVVTSPSDGLSYFLDVPQIGDNADDWMMTIPYAYLECGPTIESTTEAFSLTNMVLRHFPASASMGHWTNLGGGVTIEDNGEGKHQGGGGGGNGRRGGGSKYIHGNHEGKPQLVVALSPIEITVSGNNEESRIFNSGEVILMEDTIGKGHKMKAAPAVSHDKAESPGGKTGADPHGQDMSVLIVTLPHTVHFPMDDWLLEETSYDMNPSADDEGEEESPDSMPTRHSSSSAPLASSPPTSYNGARETLFGFAPKHLHHEHRKHLRNKKRSSSSSSQKPCPLEYDSAYSSLFMPTAGHGQYHRRHQRNRRRDPRWRDPILTAKDSSFDNDTYPPPPGYSTYEKESLLLQFLPSLRRTMLFGLGLSSASSFIYLVQLLYPPLLVLWGGATIVVSGALLNVLVTRWGYRNWVANWVEEWRWKREVTKMRSRKLDVKRVETIQDEFHEGEEVVSEEEEEEEGQE